MAGEQKEALSVSMAVAVAKNSLQSLPSITVVGEVSGFRGPNSRSGHCYFAVKDEASAMDVIVWRGVAASAGFELRDGLEIQVTGKFDVYERSGRMSFVARKIEVAGEGLLRQQVAELAKRLEAEGLAAASHKLPVPAFCERVCVVTSLSGAVREDVRRTLERRNKLVAIDYVGCAVQGPDAPASIIRALSLAAGTRPDAILLVRGGGSYEDLMAFNDESLARAIYACPVPVVTGIGHEPDYSIADMVADRSMSTPTAAAESVAPALDELQNVIQGRVNRMVNAMSQEFGEQEAFLQAARDGLARSMGSRLALERSRVDALAASGMLTSPQRIVTARCESVELSAERLHGAMDGFLSLREQAADWQAGRLATAGPRVLAGPRSSVALLARSLGSAGSSLLAPYQAFVGQSAASLDALSPLKVLGRGYAIAYSDEGHVVDSVGKAAAGSPLTVRVSDGTIDATVTAVHPAAS